ncbi:hypothetical protein ACS5PN_06980 [Roseateles sp. NT4]|uniref:hypothetical protein n=1 Tax=Roseateles sp. NT4 TaxID=3453715 RepID=UPI003EEFBC31
MRSIPSTSPWRQPMVWLVVAGPTAVVVASFFTLALAIRHPDPPLELRHAVAADDVADLRSNDSVPALTARNHAATGTAGLKP